MGKIRQCVKKKWMKYYVHASGLLMSCFLNPAASANTFACCGELQFISTIFPLCPRVSIGFYETVEKVIGLLLLPVPQENLL